ncbi:FAD/NAD(P)-binding domain-containing protein [Mollisia scopiformis]|uniref:FAD/NAD(P)-binding domain-containing protein n=1 Tax=Mollisia scopiformis TaxID=149040 RepID=A0A132B9M6_MOLSC|nr:FAD/NAD(P)-binding domain-containing protein [Mollisia scopiformis]KUJ09108.1 FAD/NAD(P)-binding domain-containing protein [Mollisia scopiformis]
MATNAKQRLESLSRHLGSTPSHNERPKFELEDHPGDAVRSLKVAVIGAGISGVIAGVLLPAKVPGIDLTIFEKNADVGGTWFENIYPGVRCDIPANVYQSSFAPNTQWTEEFAQGAEIRAYWQNVVKKHGVYKYIQFKKKISQAEWDPTATQWVSVEERFDILVTAIGRFNAWKLPNYPGINEYEGHLRHSSNWDPSFDPKGKTVAVIGNGASGIQVVPELQKVVKHLDHYARSKTWIAGSFAGHERKAEPILFSAEQLKDLEDPEKYLTYRKGVEETYWRRFAALFKDSDENKNAREEFKAIMKKRLEEKPELLDDILPEFSPHCRRLTPGPGYLEALSKDNVSFIRTPIKRFTKTGIETEDGIHRPVDAIICSTGANIDYATPFSVVSGGIDLSKAWKPDGEFGFPYSYLGLATPGFPNLFFIHGPNTSGASGTLPNSVENQVTHIARLLRKISGEGIKTVVPKKGAADDFVEFCDAFFLKTVLSENCSSWANGGIPGGRIHGLWPGSAAHVNFIRRSPRWEDFEYQLRSPNGSKNRFAYWENGWTSKQLQPVADLTSYLKVPEKVDLKDLHESWWDV